MHIQMPSRETISTSHYTWLVILQHMLRVSGVPTDAQGAQQFIDLATRYGEQMLRDPTLMIVWEQPYYINEYGEVVRALNAMPVLKSHIGKHSIDTSGVLSQDVFLMPPPSIGSGSYVNWCVEVSRLKRNQITIDFAENRIRIQSILHFMQATTQFAGTFDMIQDVSRFMPAQTVICQRRFPELQSRKIDDIEENAYSKFLKSGILNKHSIEVFVNDALQPTQLQRNELTERMNKIISRGLGVFDNTYMYFKLWCHIYMRAMFSSYNEPVQIPVAAAPTRLVFVQFGDPANVPNWNDLDTYASEQYLTAFETRNHTQNFITMLHILGDDTLYFDSVAGNPVCPWHGIRFPGVHILYLM